MVPAQNRPKICKIVSVYSVCSVCVQCVYSVCTLCAAKPHRHRPELPEFASSEGCRPTNYALIMHWLCTDFTMIICYLVTFSILKQRPFQNRLMKLTNLIMHWLFTDFTIIICYLVTFFNSKTTPFLNRLMKLTNLRKLGESTDRGP